MQQYEEMNGSPIIPACKNGNGTAREVSNGFAPSLVGAAVAAGERERGLRGMVDSNALPPETCGDKPVRYTCSRCGRRTCFSGLCTSCLEERALSEERTEAWHQGYRVDSRGIWRRRR